MTKSKMTILLIALPLVLTACTLGGETWDLMICETLMANGVECYDNSYVLKGYKSQTECMEKGIELASTVGFECGKNCKPSKDFGGTVCKTICNSAGCN